MKKQKSKGKFIARQGDVLITRISALPQALKRVPHDNGRVILAYGEVTGHSHALRGEHCELFTPTALGATVTYLEVKEAMVALTHDEHAPIELAPGVYEITRQREYHPEAIRNVAD
jgi:hypothetical protein